MIAFGKKLPLLSSPLLSSPPCLLSGDKALSSSWATPLLTVGVCVCCVCVGGLFEKGESLQLGDTSHSCLCGHCLPPPPSCCALHFIVSLSSHSVTTRPLRMKKMGVIWQNTDWLMLKSFSRKALLCHTSLCLCSCVWRHNPFRRGILQ